ncbi:hypothetical protein AGMMS49983_20490 [Clostridia bacterium]|nr:hypothetical protein AGMMS49983_20490 [Clostridia bacterium]
MEMKRKDTAEAMSNMTEMIKEHLVCDILEAALPFMESEEMRECLRRNADPKRVRGYIDIIMASRASLNRKAEALKTIADSFNKLREIMGGDLGKESPGEMAVACEFALEEAHKEERDAVFLLTEHWRPDVSDWWDVIPFSSFAAAEQRIAVQRTKLGETVSNIEEKVWFIIGKWMPEPDGSMRQKMTWILNTDGDIWFAEIQDSDDKDFFPAVNHPISFQAGDIITIDCSPFVAPLHAVLSVSDQDGNGTCYDWCVYNDEKDGSLRMDDLQFGIFNGWAPVPALLRVSRHEGPLPSKEAVLQEISEALKIDSSLAEKLMDDKLWSYGKITWKAGKYGD